MPNACSEAVPTAEGIQLLKERYSELAVESVLEIDPVRIPSNGIHSKLERGEVQNLLNLENSASHGKHTRFCGHPQPLELPHCVQT